MIAIGAGVGNDAHLHRRQRSVALCADFHVDAHRMACGRGDEFLFAREFEHDRTAGLQSGKRANIFGQHFLLAAEAAAYTLAKDANALGHQVKKVAELLLGDMGRLAAGANVEPIFLEPGDRAVRFEMRMLYAMRSVGGLVDHVGRVESCRDVANVAVNLEQDILPRTPDARLGALVVNDGSALAHRFFRIKDRRQHFVIDLDFAASFFRRAHGFRDDRRNPLAHEAHDVVEQVRVIGIDVIIVVGGGREQQARHILPCVNSVHARNSEGGILEDRLDARVRMR